MDIQNRNVFEIRNAAVAGASTGTECGDGYKACTVCGEYKPVHSYHKQGRNKPKRADCDECRRATVRKYHEDIRKIARAKPEEAHSTLG